MRWFDAFRSEGGPTLYSYSNRTPVTGDPPTIALYLIFVTLAIAFLIIFPGIRKERFSTFTSVTLSLFVGSAILVSKYGSGWHVAETTVTTAYRAFSREKVSAALGVHIGLTHFNVTLQGLPIVNSSSHEDIDFNERFYWVRALEIQDELRSALQKGLPYPILTVVEYFSMDDEGFSWGRDYRQAGYYAGILLWASFASWLLMNLLIIVVPRYGAYQMVLTGLLLLLTNLLYLILIPTRPPIIRFEDDVLVFRLGTSFWLILAAGFSCVGVGGLISIVDLCRPHSFSTVLEVDYDTPYDRHIIITDSNDTRKKKGKRSLEEPDGIGRKILRTLSKRGSKKEEDDLQLAHEGHPNEAFQMEQPVPNSPWRTHQFFPRDNQQHELRGSLASAFAKNPALLRLAAPNPKSSPKAVSFRRQSRLETTYTVEDRRKDSSSSAETQHEEPISFQKLGGQRSVVRTASTDSRLSSASSFGLGLLSRAESQVNIHQPSSRKKSPPNHPPLQRISYSLSQRSIPRASLSTNESRKSSKDSSSSNQSTSQQNSRKRDW